MQYKRIIAWTLDRDFGKLKPYIPDTTYNYHFHDYPFQRNDVNASWLGVAGSPVQYYNWFKRGRGEGVEFYDAFESCSYSPETLPHYNSKTPHTELAYFGTLFAGKDKESNNLRLFTTQNITPAFNFALLYERYGGEGMLENEKTSNSTAVAQVNYLGKRYTAHAGYIGNSISMGENGGMQDLKWVRDTTVNSRDIPVNLKNAQSKLKKRSFFIDQQLRIPFNFINRIRASRDTTYKYNADSLDRNITTAYIGHSGEVSTYSRKYTDQTSDEAARAFYNNVFNHNPSASADSLGMTSVWEIMSRPTSTAAMCAAPGTRRTQSTPMPESRGRSATISSGTPKASMCCSAMISGTSASKPTGVWTSTRSGGPGRAR